MEIEYGFGTGDGHVSVWHSPADLDVSGDGVFDAVLLDFDGDGVVDDAMWDSDGDGIADTVVLGVYGDDPQRRFVDAAGDGTWAQAVPLPMDLDPGSAGGDAEDPMIGAEVASERGDCAAAEPASDQGRAAPVVVAAPEGGGLLWVDTDGDGLLDTRLSDTTGDGLLDTAETVRSEDEVTEPESTPHPDGDGS